MSIEEFIRLLNLYIQCSIEYSEANPPGSLEDFIEFCKIVMEWENETGEPFTV